MIRFALLLLVPFVFFAAPAWAGEPRLIGSYQDWDAYVFTENDDKVCYMAARPKKGEGEYKRRGDVFAMITFRPADNTKDVFSYITGYTYKPGSEATLKIDNQSFKLFTQDETAWAVDSETDSKIAAALRNGSKMTVSGTSSRNTKTTDSFGLSGSGKAYDKITQECAK